MDPRTTAAAARYHQLESQGIPPPQIMATLQQESGLVPVQQLAAAYQQLKQAAQRSQIQPPQPGNVAQHIFAADAQLHGQMPPQQMPPEMQQMPPQQMQPPSDPRMTGIAQIPNTMGRTGYASGGIVAFSGKDNDQQVQSDDMGFDPDTMAPLPQDTWAAMTDEQRRLYNDYIEKNRAKHEAYLERLGGPKASESSKKLFAATAVPTPAALAQGAANPAANPSATPAATGKEVDPAVRGAIQEFLANPGDNWKPGMVGASAPGVGGGFHAAGAPDTTTSAGLVSPAALSASERVSLRGGLGGIKPVTADTSALDAEMARINALKKAGKLSEYTDEVAAENKRLGIGNAYDQMAKYYDKQENDLKDWAKYDRRHALANAGFKMAIAAGQPGQAGSGLTKLLNSGAVFGAEATQGLMSLKKEERANNQRMMENRLRLAQANELIQSGNLKEGLALRAQAVQEDKFNERTLGQLAIDKTNAIERANQANSANQAHILGMQISAAARPYQTVQGDVFHSLLGSTNPTTGKNYTAPEAYQYMQDAQHKYALQMAHDKLIVSDENYKRTFNKAYGPKADPKDQKVIDARNAVEVFKRNYLATGEADVGQDRGTL
jgi:hypothetical protein